MDKLAEAALKVLPEYMSFLLRFVSAPRTTMRQYSGKARIEPELVVFVVVSVVVSWVIRQICLAILLDPEQQDHASEILAIVYSRFRPVTSNPFIIPLALLLLVLLLGALLHAIAALYHRSLNLRGPEDNDFRLGGSIWDTLNGAFGFAVLYVPSIVGLTSITTFLYFRPEDRLDLTMFWLDVGASVGLLGYLPVALSGSHPNTSIGQASLATAVGLGGLLMMLRSLG